MNQKALLTIITISVIIATILTTCSMHRTTGIPVKVKTNKIIIKGNSEAVNVHIMNNDSIFTELADTTHIDSLR